jgi:hypothetical protein
MVGRLVAIDGTTARLDWNGIEVTVPAPAGAASGDAVEYFIKCERIAVTQSALADSGAGRNHIEGRLLDVIFKGQTADYLVVLPNGAQITVSDASQRLGFRRGDAVSVAWPFDAGQAYLARPG